MKPCCDTAARGFACAHLRSALEKLGWKPYPGSGKEICRSDGTELGRLTCDCEEHVRARQGRPPARPSLDSRLFTAAGEEVVVKMICTACHRSKPFRDFGIRKMAGGKLRSIPQCRTCRGGSRAKRTTD